MMIPVLESSSSKDSSTARVQPKPYRLPLPPLQSDDNDNDTNDNDTMALPSINIGGALYGNDDGFTAPAIHHYDHIIHIRYRELLPEFPDLSLPNNDLSSSSTSKQMTSLKPRIRRRSISIKEKRPLLARSA